MQGEDSFGMMAVMAVLSMVAIGVGLGCWVTWQVLK
jgi:hypothetical protein